MRYELVLSNSDKVTDTAATIDGAIAAARKLSREESRKDATSGIFVRVFAVDLKARTLRGKSSGGGFTWMMKCPKCATSPKAGGLYGFTWCTRCHNEGFVADDRSSAA